MRIDRIRGKLLLAVLGEDEPVDERVCRQIYDQCRRRDVHRVGLVYPLRRLDDVLPFMREVRRITGQPVEGFSHDSADIKQTVH